MMDAILSFMNRIAATMLPTSLSSSCRSRSAWRLPSASSSIWSETLMIGVSSSVWEKWIVRRHCCASLINPARKATAQMICITMNNFLDASRRSCIFVMTSSVRELIFWIVSEYSFPKTYSVAAVTSPAATAAIASSSRGTRLSESAAISLSSAHS